LERDAGARDSPACSKVKDYAGGNASLILGVASETGDEVVDLDGANPDVRNKLQVDAGAEGGGESGSGAGQDGERSAGAGESTGRDGLMRATEENVSEGRDAAG